MPSCKEPCLHQKRRSFNIKKYTLRWSLMWEMHEVAYHFLFALWHMKYSWEDWLTLFLYAMNNEDIILFLIRVYKISYHLSIQINHHDKCSWLWLMIFYIFLMHISGVEKLVTIGRSWLDLMYSTQKIRIFLLYVEL